MTAPKPVRLEFTDCLGCGKRVATTAPVCRHCNTERVPAQSLAPTAQSAAAVRPHLERLDPEDIDAESHAALGIGGYAEDDFDEETGSSTKRKNLWWYVALVLLIFFTISAFLPWF